MKALGEAASELPWITPSTASLIQLTRSEPDWHLLRRDPGAVLLLLRTGTFPSSSADPAETPTVLQLALNFMSLGKARPIAWNKSGANRIYNYCLEYAALAESLAESLPRSDAARAWMTGLLAPLGWLAVCAVQPAEIGQSWRDFVRSGRQSVWQHQNWGLDHAALVRRLSRAWNLPPWIAAVIGYVGLPVDIAVPLGAEPVLFQTVQLAIALRQRDDPALALPIGSEIPDLLRSLDLSKNEADRIVQESRASATVDDSLWKAPRKRQLLRELLRSAEQAINSCAPAAQARDSTDLHAMKMAALAELAAGAGHEINNPLAVISGQAEYIARKLEQARSLIPEEPALTEYLTTLQDGIARSLKSIRGQTQRINNVLTGLMQFARPAPPQPGVVTVRELLREVLASVHDLAGIRKVKLVCQEVPDSWRLNVDPRQTHTALACLLRNAVEAAPPEGWAGLRAESAGENCVKLLVEDNGPGVVPQALEHIFDPFYSGRSAGRGQGLGLPIAWRLARQQRGEVVYSGHMDGVTRFTLTLPGLESGYCAPDANGPAGVNGEMVSSHVGRDS